MTALSRFTVVGMAAALAVVGLTVAALAAASPAQKAIVDQHAAAAKAADPAFQGFSADRGKAFFYAKHTGGKPDSPSCTSCHTTDLTKPGRTRAGKEIAPMAASTNPTRFGDAPNVEKWFKRNCSDVLGRECTVVEKGDVLTYLLSL
jgi:cytochrome c peroxidase